MKLLGFGLALLVAACTGAPLRLPGQLKSDGPGTGSGESRPPLPMSEITEMDNLETQLQSNTQHAWAFLDDLKSLLSVAVVEHNLADSELTKEMENALELMQQRIKRGSSYFATSAKRLAADEAQFECDLEAGRLIAESDAFLDSLMTDLVTVEDQLLRLLSWGNLPGFGSTPKPIGEATHDQ